MCGILACITLANGQPACQHANHEDIYAYMNGDTTNYSHANGHELAKQLQGGLDKIRHRGPDGYGVWISPYQHVGLGHCRLSINDLSPSGSQPLHSDCGEIHAVVNGEIYDFDRLREECKIQYGYQFHSESDSELVVALYKIHGAPAFFEHLRGEFAFVLYDDRDGKRRTIAGRDRFGIKPLVYTTVGNKLLIGSEAKGFLTMGWEPEWNVKGIMDSGWMADDRTVFKNVRKLMPGHWLDVTEENGVELKMYWNADYADKKVAESRSIDEMVQGTREKLVEAIRLRMRADVPIGIYLSGGIDSSTVAGIVSDLARKENVKIGNESKTRVTCFTVCFPHESGYDESDIADRTAKWLGVEMHKRYVTEDTIARDFSDAAYHCEHHHFDLNTVSKFALSTLPHEHGIKVVITGEGSDEHFAGYPYFPAEFLREKDWAQPESILAKDDKFRDEMQLSASAEMNAVWRSQGAAEYDGMDNSVLSPANGNTMPDSLLAWHPSAHLFQQWVRDQYPKGRLDMRHTLMDAHTEEVLDKMKNKWHPLHTAMYMWNKSTLINVILSCLGDRTEMAHSIEARTPFLDHHVAEYVNALPPSVKLRYTPPEEENSVTGGDTNNFWWKAAGSSLRNISEKWILREAARPYITDELYKRRKVPFLAPTKWTFDGPIHGMFKTLLTQDAVEKLGFVNWHVVEDALPRAFGKNADSVSFRILCYVGGWVSLSRGFGVKTASAKDWATCH